MNETRTLKKSDSSLKRANHSFALFKGATRAKERKSERANSQPCLCTLYSIGGPAHALHDTVVLCVSGLTVCVPHTSHKITPVEILQKRLDNLEKKVDSLNLSQPQRRLKLLNNSNCLQLDSLCALKMPQFQCISSFEVKNKGMVHIFFTTVSGSSFSFWVRNPVNPLTSAGHFTYVCF